MIEKPTKIAQAFAREAGAYCVTKETQSKADLKKDEGCLCWQRRNPGGPWMVVQRQASVEHGDRTKPLYKWG